jgi:hypothetical protein
MDTTLSEIENDRTCVAYIDLSTTEGLSELIKNNETDN